MPMYMYQIAYTPESWAAQLKNRRTELKPRLVRHARPSGANWLVVGIASVIMISFSSPMCRTTRVWQQSRWL